MGLEEEVQKVKICSKTWWGESVEGSCKSLLIIMPRTSEATQQIWAGERKRDGRGVLWVSMPSWFMQEEDT